MRTLFLTSSLIFAMSGAAFAQYTGPSSEDGGQVAGTSTVTGIQSILDNPSDDQNVVLEGTLIRKVGDEMYLFSDGTSQINVEIDDDDFPQGDVSDTTRVRIEGEVDTHLMRDTDIEADRVTILD